MAAALQQLDSGVAANARPTTLCRGGLLRFVPALTLTLFLTPIAAGLIGTWLPAFGYLPALGGESFGLAPWRGLLASPGLGTSLRLTLTSGFLATAVSLALVIGFVAGCHGPSCSRACAGAWRRCSPCPTSPSPSALAS